MKKACTILGLSLLLAACSDRYYKKGLHSYESLAYSSAIGHFEKYLENHQHPDAAAKLAHSYFMVNDLPAAEKWYGRVVAMQESEAVNMLYYSRVLMKLEKYDEAKTWLKNYISMVPDDFVAEMLLVSCNTVRDKRVDTTLHSLKEVEMPDVATSFAQRPFMEGVMFTGDRYTFKKSETYPWTGRSYLDLYFSKKDRSGRWLSPMLLNGDVNGEYHEGPACFSKDGNTVYFTRSNYKGRKLQKNARNESNLKIYRAELVGDKWTNLYAMPFNSDEYSCGHPSLSEDGKTLYFISDMPGGFGGTDVYKAVLSNGEWSAVENLGPGINTGGNEMFPYMHSDGTLYFSSDAHNNLGGMDVFMSSFDGKRWLQVENLNYPLNSAADDFAYVLNKDGKSGYVSSNRYGGDKMFEFTKHDPTFILGGVVKHRGRLTGIDSAMVEVHNITADVKETLYTAMNGSYKVRLRPNSAYAVRAAKAMFYPVGSSELVSTKGKKLSENFTANFELEQMILEKPIVLQNIYYDLDKWEIRPDAAKELDRLAEVLKDNPRISIELSSHTDSRAGDQYNLVLSDKRAKAAVSYLVAKGIDARRLRWKGYGESKLLNHCGNNVVCSEELHQQNRRTEFKVIKIINLITKL